MSTAADCCRPLAAESLAGEEAEATARLFKALAEPARAERRAGLRLRVHSGARSQPGHRQPPPQEADRGRLAGARAAGKVVLLLAGSRRSRTAGEHRPVPGGRPVSDGLREQVRARYAEAAKTAGCGSGSCCEAGGFGAALYSAEERAGLPDAATLASLGCGNPTAVADLHEGEVVLDLGSGGGIDVILSAKRVGETGLPYGLDMTDEMLALARRNAAEAGVANVHFLKGVIEQIPLPASSVDVVISNCVINLSVDKPVVLTEIARVLKPGGRIGISDVVAELIGTFALVFAGWGAIMVDAKTHAVGHVGVAISFGLVIMVMIYAVGHISGAHFNAAVTFAFALSRHFPWPRALAYWAAQLVGALTAAALLRGSLGNLAHVGATLPSGSQGQAFLWELVMSAFLMFVILAVATDTRAVGEAAAIAIGGTIALDALFGGPVTGASMNPMRSLGPALVSGDLHALWLYIVAPLVGAALGGLAYQFVRGEQPRAAELLGANATASKEEAA